MARRRKSYARRVKGFARKRYSKSGGWKPIVTKLSVGAGAALLTGIAMQKVGINIPLVKYVPAFMLGGPVGIAGALAVDVLSGSGIPFLSSGVGSAGGPVV